MWEIIMWILAIYGILKLVQDIIELIDVRKILNGEIQIIVKVFNQQENIYEIVENISKDIPNATIKVEDAGSYDNTYKILQGLEKEYKNLYVTKM